MLRITVERASTGSILKLEGKLSGPWLRELEECWRREHPASIELTGVTYMDGEAKKLLASLNREGTALQAAGLNRAVIEGIIRAEKASKSV